MRVLLLLLTLASAAFSATGQFRPLGRWPSGNLKWVEACGIVPSLEAGGVTQVVLAAPGLSAPLTVHEKLFLGGSTGVTRTNEPFCVGVPIPDDAGVSQASSFSFGGTQVVPDGGLATDNGATITVNTGPAQFTIRKARHNGIDTAVVGEVTLVASGTSDGFTVIGPDATAAYPGNVTCAPDAGGTACATVYRSANDDGSSCVIEQNGPINAVIKCTFDHKSDQGQVYMHGTARYQFQRGRASVSITSVLRNADYGTSNTFESAYKGMDAYEFRLRLNTESQTNYKIRHHQGTQTGTLSGNEYAYLYQGRSLYMRDVSTGCGYGCVYYTTDDGYWVNVNGTNVVVGTENDTPMGWADVSLASGAGVQIGSYLLGAHGPKSLEFNEGGRDVRVGLFARQNLRPVYVGWPVWKIRYAYLNFHEEELTQPDDEFLKMQHSLVARATIPYYNSTKVFPYPLLDPEEEDGYYQEAVLESNPSISSGRACCIADLGTADTYNWPLQTRYFRWWGEGGGGNQTEFRWSQLLNFITRGHTGRYMHVAHAIRQQAEVMLPHSDGFNWRDRPQFGQPGAELDGFGFPTATSANSSLGFKNWMASGVDAGEHTHWWGMIDYYYLSGDETIKDALLDGPKDYYMTRYTYQNGKAGESTQSKGGNGLVTVSADGYTVTRNSGTNFQTSWGVGHNAGIFINGYAYNVASVESTNSLTLMQPAPPQTNVNYSIMGGPHNTRSTGLILQGVARFGAFLKSIGDPDADEVLLTGRNVFRAQLRPHLCMSGYPEGCDPGNLSGGPFFTGGINRKRGIHQTHKNSGISEYCSVSVGGWRANIHFQTTTMAHGLWEFRQVMGPEWEDYWLALDLATGLVQWTIIENYGWDGTGNWQTNGFRRYVPLDHPADPQCDTVQWPAQDAQSMWLSFWFYHQIFGKTDWEPKMKLAMHRMMASLGLRTADFGQFHLMSAISSVLHPGQKSLRDLPFNLQANGSGSYTLTWTAPPGADYYRIKWSQKRIVDWIGFDALTNTFIGDAAQEDNWFAAENAPNIPAPAAPGTPQSITIETGVEGLSSANFSVRAWATGVDAPPAEFTPSWRGGIRGDIR